MGDYRNIVINPRGAVEVTGDKATADEAEFHVRSRHIHLNESRHTTSGTQGGSASQAITSTFVPLSFTNDTTRDILSGTNVLSASSAGAGDYLSWSGFPSNAAIVNYRFRVAQAAGGDTIKSVQVAHVLSGTANGGAIAPTDISSRYFGIHTHYVSGAMASNYVFGSFPVIADSRMRTSGSQLMVAVAGTGGTVTSASLNVIAL